MNEMLQIPGHPWPWGLEVVLVGTRSLSPSLFPDVSPQCRPSSHSSPKRKKALLPPRGSRGFGFCAFSRHWRLCGSSLPPSRGEFPKEMGKRLFWVETTLPSTLGIQRLPTQRWRRCEEQRRAGRSSKFVAMMAPPKNKRSGASGPECSE